MFILDQWGLFNILSGKTKFAENPILKISLARVLSPILIMRQEERSGFLDHPTLGMIS